MLLLYVNFCMYAERCCSYIKHEQELFSFSSVAADTKHSLSVTITLQTEHIYTNYGG